MDFLTINSYVKPAGDNHSRTRNKEVPRQLNANTTEIRDQYIQVVPDQNGSDNRKTRNPYVEVHRPNTIRIVVV